MPNLVRFNAEYPIIKESEGWYGRSHDLIPAYSQTLAKGPTQFVNGVAPKYLQRGKGARVWDVDGNEYLDYNAGIGPISLGYSYDVVDNAIKRQLDDGITFSLVHPLEVELAELIRAVVPNAESVRYGKTGAEVTLKIRGLYFPSIQNHHGAQRGKRQMARKEKTAIKHVGCGGVVLEYCSWGRPMYQCSKCYQKSREIDFFTIQLLLAQLGGQKQNDDTSS